ncbi:unnamed protein product [Phaeothamnion confervicola]
MLAPPKELLRMLNQARRGFDVGLVPTLSLEGTGGTYFLVDTLRRRIGCFKPADEEPFAPNNPRGLVGGGSGGGGGGGASDAAGNGVLSMRRGIRPGEACIREVAAYLLDAGFRSGGRPRRGCAGVPMTMLVEAKHPAFNNGESAGGGGGRVKMGSFQEFVRHDELVADLGPSRLPADAVHRIAILDIRLLNNDRNDANILVRRRTVRRHGGHSGSSNGCSGGGAGSGNGSGSDHGRDGSGGGSGGSSGSQTELELIPIDHGYCLPSVLEIGWCDWTWIDWPQLREPLSRETRAYVLSLDADADAARVARDLHLRPPCLRNFRVAGLLLRTGVEAGLSLHTIAFIVARHDLDSKSELEVLIDRAAELARAAVENDHAVPALPRRAAHLSAPAATTVAIAAIPGARAAEAVPVSAAAAVAMAVPAAAAAARAAVVTAVAASVPPTCLEGTQSELSSGTGSNASVAMQLQRGGKHGRRELRKPDISGGTAANGITSARDGALSDSSESSGGEGRQRRPPLGFWRESMSEVDARNRDRCFEWGSEHNLRRAAAAETAAAAAAEAVETPSSAVTDDAENSSLAGGRSLYKGGKVEHKACGNGNGNGNQVAVGVDAGTAGEPSLLARQAAVGWGSPCNGRIKAGGSGFSGPSVDSSTIDGTAWNDVADGASREDTVGGSNDDEGSIGTKGYSAGYGSSVGYGDSIGYGYGGVNGSNGNHGNGEQWQQTSSLLPGRARGRLLKPMGITRSISYHGLRSEPLYDDAGSASNHHIGSGGRNHRNGGGDGGGGGDGDSGGSGGGGLWRQLHSKRRALEERPEYESHFFWFCRMLIIELCNKKRRRDGEERRAREEQSAAKATPQQRGGLLLSPDPPPPPPLPGEPVRADGREAAWL